MKLERKNGILLTFVILTDDDLVNFEYNRNCTFEWWDNDEDVWFDFILFEVFNILIVFIFMVIGQICCVSGNTWLCVSCL
jgi:hypothetical protein